MRILLGITGGIAAYKAANLIRGLSELGHEVTVLPTENALRFIGKPTLEALSGHAIETDMYQDVAAVRHVELGQQADLILIAPATASFIARLTAGIADDLMLNAILASEAPVFLAPAMHTQMWQNPATQANLKTLESRGIRLLAPASGRLTGGDSGPGRLPETQEIIDFVLSAGKLSGKHVIVTAGGTREPIDEVRFLGNSSSGRMGIELAIAARDEGAKVTLIAANIELPIPGGIDTVSVSSVDELEAAMDQSCDVLVMAAAVSDYKLAKPHRGKLPRNQSLTLELLPTKDLIANFAVNHPEAYCVAFALVAQEDSNLLTIAEQKLWDKGVNAIVANRSSALGSKVTEVTFVTKDDQHEFSGEKSSVSVELIRQIAGKLS
ncbi:MAG: bifunctional phosphopantothenoylcysteine decarboxylase/phosphopantothenate--cysteine ligase CoaBC [Aquiluna sp.]|nr:bifunctional phosphopantothenoylcysteine decarboxylase/phosphopantothenate--cysteine ligase CoaBC [Aquiluna sp.]MCF8545073.1 bifunctional phosphopantothenoylcysteine decarboxylase/phosphopantothenate--cysteine ligase CoaBC [Aquiluna sp.]